MKKTFLILILCTVCAVGGYFFGAKYGVNEAEILSKAAENLSKSTYMSDPLTRTMNRGKIIAKVIEVKSDAIVVEADPVTLRDAMVGNKVKMEIKINDDTAIYKKVFVENPEPVVQTMPGGRQISLPGSSYKNETIALTDIVKDNTVVVTLKSGTSDIAKTIIISDLE